MARHDLNLEMEVNDFVGYGLEMDNLPIKVYSDAIKRYPRYIVKEVLSELIECKRQYNECERTGHKWNIFSHITPESGVEYLTCKKCGCSHNIIYY